MNTTAAPESGEFEAMMDVHVTQKLIELAVELGGHKTRSEAADQALRDYIRTLQNSDWKDWIGKVEYYDGL